MLRSICAQLIYNTTINIKLAWYVLESILQNLVTVNLGKITASHISYVVTVEYSDQSILHLLINPDTNNKASLIILL